MSSGTAKSLAYVALAVSLVAIWLKGRSAGQPIARRAVGATILGSVCVILSGPAPQIAGPLAGILMADTLVVGPGGNSISNAVGNVISPPPLAEPQITGGSQTPGQLA